MASVSKKGIRQRSRQIVGAVPERWLGISNVECVGGSAQMIIGYFVSRVILRRKDPSDAREMHPSPR